MTFPQKHFQHVTLLSLTILCTMKNVFNKHHLQISLSYCHSEHFVFHLYTFNPIFKEGINVISTMKFKNYKIVKTQRMF